MDGAITVRGRVKNSIYTLSKIYVKTKKNRSEKPHPRYLPPKASHKKLPPLPPMRRLDRVQDPDQLDVAYDDTPDIYWESPRVTRRKLGDLSRPSRRIAYEEVHHERQQYADASPSTLVQFASEPPARRTAHPAVARETSRMWSEVVRKIMVQQRVVGAFLNRYAGNAADRKASWSNIVQRLHIYSETDRSRRSRAPTNKYERYDRGLPSYGAKPELYSESLERSRNGGYYRKAEPQTSSYYQPVAPPPRKYPSPSSIKEKRPSVGDQYHANYEPHPPYHTAANANAPTHAASTKSVSVTLSKPAGTTFKLQQRFAREITLLNKVNKSDHVDLQVTGFATPRHTVNGYQLYYAPGRAKQNGSSVKPAPAKHFADSEGVKPPAKAAGLSPEVVRYRGSRLLTRPRGPVTLQVPQTTRTAKVASAATSSPLSGSTDDSKPPPLFSQSYHDHHQRPGGLSGSPEPRRLGSPEPARSDGAAAGEISLIVPNLPRLKVKEASGLSQANSDIKGKESEAADGKTIRAKAFTDAYEPVVIITDVEGQSMSANAWPTESRSGHRSPTEDRESGYLSAPSSKLSERSKSRTVSRLSTITSSSGGFLEVPFANVDSRSHSPASSIFSDAVPSRSASRVSALTTASSRFLEVPSVNLADMDPLPKTRFPAINSSSQIDINSNIESDCESITIPLPMIIRHSHVPGNVT